MNADNPSGSNPKEPGGVCYTPALEFLERAMNRIYTSAWYRTQGGVETYQDLCIVQGVLEKYQKRPADQK